MRLAFCVACGSTEDLQHHHLVTRAEQGSEDETNLITLCEFCHAKLHERRTNGVYSHSQRPKAALAAAKARGQVLGGPRLAEAAAIGHARLKADADAHAAAAMPAIREAQAAGAKSLRQIAAALNGRGIATARGGKWEAATVRNILWRSS
jgi:hypothetical protein